MSGYSVDGSQPTVSAGVYAGTAYHEALDWLYVRTRAGGPRSPAPMRELLRLLDLKIPPRIAHVVGTNGKGTVAAMIAAGMSAAGFRSGRFTSPHVEDFRERIAVDAERISEARVAELTTWLRQAVPEPLPSFFELALAMALRHFDDEGVEFVALEAGVGARNDATIALGNTAVAVVTSIGPDHLDVLGGTLEEIAADKSAAIRPGVPAVTAEKGTVLQVIEAAAAAGGSPLYHPATHPGMFELPPGVTVGRGTRFVNQRLAAAALRVLGVEEQAVAAGVDAAPLPARGERFVVDGIPVVLDGAHDPSAAAALASEFEQPFVLLYSGFQRKQQLATLAPLAARASDVIITSLRGEPLLAAPGARGIADHGAALAAALATAAARGTQVVIAGSLYLAGDLRPLLRARASAAAGDDKAYTG